MPQSDARLQALADEVDLIRAALPEFDREAFNAGHLTPVYFGSAIKGIGVADLLDGLAELRPAAARPAGRHARTVEASEPGLTALVFKIQANMDPNHRDRIAFARVCSGRLARGMRLKQVRTGKLIPLHAPQFFFAREREMADEAFAGDVVGIPNHGTLRIGDTLTDGEDINFVGVPYFAPEILRRVRLDDAMKAKKLRQALVELAEEGVVQLFRPQDGAAPLVGVVGTLQLDVLRRGWAPNTAWRSASRRHPMRWRAGCRPRQGRRCRSSSRRTAARWPTMSMAIRCSSPPRPS